MGQRELTALCDEVDFLEGDWEGVPDGGSGLRYESFELHPTDFLRQAELDLAHRTQGGDQNAIANAKRAIFCQIDQILLAFGYKPLRWNNDRRVRTIAAMGISAPRILGKINATRNLLEHSYRRVARAEAEDAVDVAALFIGSASPVLRLFPTDFYLGAGTEGKNYERGISCQFAYDGSAEFSLNSFGSAFEEEVTLTSADHSFPYLVALALATDRDLMVSEAIENFRASITAARQEITAPTMSR